ncbi:leucine-rich repeat-containing protein 37A isoform X3 [Vicugna pacos]|uniref:Leucine-rich repeat-containing protein 37A isoform X3 n=1 Tax=Vicugna pacos TaxID=30538 RepID=A0ABM5BJ74_VICPA
MAELVPFVVPTRSNKTLLVWELSSGPGTKALQGHYIIIPYEKEDNPEACYSKGYDRCIPETAGCGFRSATFLGSSVAKGRKNVSQMSALRRRSSDAQNWASTSESPRRPGPVTSLGSSAPPHPHPCTAGVWGHSGLQPKSCLVVRGARLRLERGPGRRSLRLRFCTRTWSQMETCLLGHIRILLFHVKFRRRPPLSLQSILRSRNLLHSLRRPRLSLQSTLSMTLPHSSKRPQRKFQGSLVRLYLSFQRVRRQQLDLEVSIQLTPTHPVLHLNRWIWNLRSLQSLLRKATLPQPSRRPCLSLQRALRRWNLLLSKRKLRLSLQRAPRRCNLHLSRRPRLSLQSILRRRNLLYSLRRPRLSLQSILRRRNLLHSLRRPRLSLQSALSMTLPHSSKRPQRKFWGSLVRMHLSFQRVMRQQLDLEAEFSQIQSKPLSPSPEHPGKVESFPGQQEATAHTTGPPEGVGLSSVQEEAPAQPPEPPKEVEMTVGTPGQNQAQHSSSPSVTDKPLDLGLTMTPGPLTEAGHSAALQQMTSHPTYIEVTPPQAEQVLAQHPAMTEFTVQPLDLELSLSPESDTEARPSPTMQGTPTWPPEPHQPSLYQEVTVPTPDQDHPEHLMLSSVIDKPLDLELTVTSEPTTEAEHSTSPPPERPEVTLTPLSITPVTVHTVDLEVTVTGAYSVDVEPSPTKQETPTQPPEPPKEVVIEYLPHQEVTIPTSSKGQGQHTTPSSVTPHHVDLELTMTSEPAVEAQHATVLRKTTAPPPEVALAHPDLTRVAVPPVGQGDTITRHPGSLKTPASAEPSVVHSVPYTSEKEQPKQSAPTSVNICELCICSNEGLSCTGLSPEERLQTVPVPQPSNYNGTFTILDFRGNSISYVDENTWKPYRWTEKLILRDNSLTELRKDSFKGLLVLRYLDLSCNKIKFIEHGTFESLPFLEFVNLGCNLIVDLSFGTFQAWHGMQFLQMINLSHNPLKTVEDSYLFKLPALRYLDLGKTEVSLTTIERILMISVELKKLILPSHRTCCLCQFKKTIEVVCKTVKLHCDSDCLASTTRCGEEAAVGNIEGSLMKVLQARKNNTSTELIIEPEKASSDEHGVSFSAFVDKQLDFNDEIDVISALNYVLPYFSEGNLDDLETAFLPFIKLLFSHLQDGDKSLGYLEKNTRDRFVQPESNNLPYKNKLQRFYHLKKWSDSEMQKTIDEVEKKEKAARLVRADPLGHKLRQAFQKQLDTARPQEKSAAKTESVGKRLRGVGWVLRGPNGIIKKRVKKLMRRKKQNSQTPVENTAKDEKQLDTAQPQENSPAKTESVGERLRGVDWVFKDPDVVIKESVNELMHWSKQDAQPAMENAAKDEKQLDTAQPQENSPANTESVGERLRGVDWVFKDPDVVIKESVNELMHWSKQDAQPAMENAAKEEAHRRQSPGAGGQLHMMRRPRKLVGSSFNTKPSLINEDKAAVSSSVPPTPSPPKSEVRQESKDSSYSILEDAERIVRNMEASKPTSHPRKQRLFLGSRSYAMHSLFQAQRNQNLKRKELLRRMSASRPPSSAVRSFINSPSREAISSGELNSHENPPELFSSLDPLAGKATVPEGTVSISEVAARTDVPSAYSVTTGNFVPTVEHTDETQREYHNLGTELPSKPTSFTSPGLSSLGDQFELQVNQQLQSIVPNGYMRGLISHLIRTLKMDCSETHVKLSCAKFFTRTGLLIKLLSEQQKEKLSQAEGDTDLWKAENYITESTEGRSEETGQEPHELTEEGPGSGYMSRVMWAVLISVAVTAVVAVLVITFCLFKTCLHRRAAKIQKKSVRGLLRRKCSEQSESQEGVLWRMWPLWLRDMHRPLSATRKKNMAQKLHDESSEEEIFSKDARAPTDHAADVVWTSEPEEPDDESETTLGSDAA